MGETAIEVSTARPIRYPGYAGLSWVSKSEMLWLIDRLPERGLFVEVGTASGVTAAKIADARPNLSIISVDPFPDHEAAHVVKDEPCRVDMWRRNRRPNMSLWLGTLRDFFDAARPRLADAILIDAGHEEHDAYSDLVLARHLLRKGGTMFAHDYDEPKLPGVRAAVDRFCEEYPMVPDGDHATLRAMLFV